MEFTRNRYHRQLTGTENKGLSIFKKACNSKGGKIPDWHTEKGQWKKKMRASSATLDFHVSMAVVFTARHHR